MQLSLVGKFKWRMAKWFWAPPGEMPFTDPELADWIQPRGVPVKNKRWHMVRKSKGTKTEIKPMIHEFYHRGSYERHESRARHDHKAVMLFRRKGAKIERRQKAR